MSLWDQLRKQAIEVIDWTEPGDELLAFRFPVEGNEIKNGARLTVRESQVALVVDQGKPADQFGPGLHTLETANLPILTTLQSWPHGFKSPFKTEVYFFSLRDKLDQRFGTPQPITLRDKEWGSVQVRMFGSFSYRLTDPAIFYRKVSGTRASYSTDELAPQLAGLVAGAIPGAFASSGVPFLDMAANQLALAGALRNLVSPEFAALGLTLDTFVIQSITLPEPLQKALAEKQSMGIVGDLGKYSQYQAAQAIPEAARNSGGLAGASVGLAAGAAMASQLAAAAAPVTPRNETRCVACGQAIEAGSAFCRHCGKPQKRACVQCGTEDATAAFCAKCGTKFP